MVQTIAEILECDSRYLGAPSFAYQIDYFTVNKTGALNFDGRVGGRHRRRFCLTPQVGAAQCIRRRRCGGAVTVAVRATGGSMPAIGKYCFRALVTALFFHIFSLLLHCIFHRVRKHREGLKISAPVFRF